MSGLTYEYIMRKGLNEPDKFWSQPEYMPNKHVDPQHRLDAIEDVQYYSDYKEPGYTNDNPNPKGVLLSDWNYYSDRTQDLLNRAGYELEYGDEWTSCYECDGLVRTQQDCYSWQPYYVITNECELICKDCLLADKSLMEDYLQSLENNPKNAVSLYDFNVEDYGYVKLDAGDNGNYRGDYQRGLHQGMNDDPRVIYAELSKTYNRLLFVITASSQFNIDFAVYYKADTDDTDDTNE